MQRYLEQLYSDIESALLRIQKTAFNHSYEEEENSEFNSDTQTPTQISEEIKLSQLTGLQKTIFPESNQLTESQKNKLGKKLEELLWSCNFIIVVPIIFSHSQRYSFIREIWNKKYRLNKGGLYIAELYSW